MELRSYGVKWLRSYGVNPNAYMSSAIFHLFTFSLFHFFTFSPNAQRKTEPNFHHWKPDSNQQFNFIPLTKLTSIV
mgnify:CR=1 FL=1